MDTHQDSTIHALNGTASVLTTEDVQRVLAEAEGLTRPASPYLQLLRWLVWLPLLSARELTRMMRKGEKTVWGYLARLEQCELTAHIVLSEPGWPRHRRYYITDLGLYVLAACYPHPLSVPNSPRVTRSSRGTCWPALPVHRCISCSPIWSAACSPNYPVATSSPATSNRGDRRTAGRASSAPLRLTQPCYCKHLQGRNTPCTCESISPSACSASGKNGHTFRNSLS